MTLQQRLDEANKLVVQKSEQYLAERRAHDVTKARCAALIEGLKPFAELSNDGPASEHHPLGYYLKLEWRRITWNGSHDLNPYTCVKARYLVAEATPAADATITRVIVAAERWAATEIAQHDCAWGEKEQAIEDELVAAVEALPGPGSR